MNRKVVLRTLAMGLGGVLLFAALFTLPIWLQNNHTQLLREQRTLQSESVHLRNEVALLKKKANLLVGRERVEKMARDRFELDYRELPIVVVEVSP